jgi:hypothetical protein
MGRSRAGKRTEFGPAAWNGAAVLGPAPILTATASSRRPHDFRAGDFSVVAWVFLPEEPRAAAILARMGGEPEAHRGWDFVREDRWRPSSTVGLRFSEAFAG